MSQIVDPKTGQPVNAPQGQQAQAAPGPQQTPQVPIDPSTGQPMINKETGQPFTPEEFQKAQEEAMQQVDLARKMLDRVFPDMLVVVSASGIVHANGEVFRLSAICEMAAEELKHYGRSKLAQLGWGRPGQQQGMQQQGPMPGGMPAMPQLTPEQQAELQKAIAAQKAKQEEAEKGLKAVPDEHEKAADADEASEAEDK